MRDDQRVRDGLGLIVGFIVGECPFISTPNEFTLNSSHAVWLENDALKDNPKIEIVPGDDGEKKYEFKPAIPVKDRKSLLQYLDKQETEGLGNISVRTDRLHSTPVDTTDGRTL